MNRFVVVYQRGLDGALSPAGRFPFAYTKEEALGLRTYDTPALGTWKDEEYEAPVPAYFFPWASIARLEYIDEAP